MLDLTVFEVVAKYNAQSRELAAVRAELHQTRSDRQREHDLRCRLAGEAEALRARVDALEIDLARAEDAAQKGRRARENAAGMELRIAELEAALEPTLKHWLADDDPDELQPLVARVKATLSAGAVQK